MRIFLFILVFLSGLSARAQTQSFYIDSLKKELNSCKEDTMKSLLLSRLCNEMVIVDAKQAIQYAEHGIKIAEKIGFKKGMALCYKNAGVCYHFASNYLKALEYLFLALKYAEKGGRVEGLTFSNIAMVYHAQEDYKKALDYYFRALDIAYELDIKYQIPYHLGSIGVIYVSEKKDSLAEVYLNKALLLNESENTGLAAILVTLGGIEKRRGHYSEALSLQLRGLKMSEGLGDNAGRCVAMNGIAETYLFIAKDSTGKIKPDSLTPSKKTALQKVYSYTQAAFELAKEQGELAQMRYAYQNLREYYHETRNSAGELEAFAQYIKLNDSIFSKENKLKIKSLENQHELDMKKKEIELRNKEIELNKLVVRKKRNESTFLIGGLGILLVVIFFILKERKKSERLLLNVLPHKIAVRLKKKEHPIADYFAEATIVFIDMAEFTKFAEVNPPKDTVSVLDNVFTLFDGIAEKYGLEKIKTIGDCYMAVSGLPDPRPDHANAAAKMALDVKHSMKDYTTPDGTKILFRIGLDCGSVVAGVIGKKKFIYDLWGDSVNMASRMESTGIAGEIQCTDNFKRKTESQFLYASRGLVEIKGKGKMETWLLQGERS